MKLSQAVLCLNCEAVFPIGTPCPDCASEKWVSIQVWLDKKILIMGEEEPQRSPSPADQRRINLAMRRMVDDAAAVLLKREVP